MQGMPRRQQMKRMNHPACYSKLLFLAPLLSVYLLIIPTLSHSATPNTYSLLDISIEDLVDIKVTTVSKKEESFTKAAASIYVITNDAIRRAGVHTLPEALRLAPNLLVAKIDSNSYAISARGFN
jgi:iron complex outermembrane receptor protein